jgi:hypothetical protein
MPVAAVGMITEPDQAAKILANAEADAILMGTESRYIMSSISIIGLGNAGRVIGARAVEGGNAVELIGLDAAKAADLAKTLGRGAQAGTFGAAPAGNIVILAVPHASAAPLVAQYGDALAGKVIVDTANVINIPG